MLPTYGPLVDIGYAEMLPGHEHITLASMGAGHGHSYATDGVGVDTTGGGGGVIALPGANDAGSSTIVAVIALAALVLGVALMPRMPFVRLWAFSPLALAGFALVPAAPPPRQASAL